jgi:predicted nucleic acid-binding protein
VLAHYIRKNLLSLSEAQQIMEEAMLLMKGREYEIASFKVLDLVASTDCSAYDCEFVALAEDLETSLVTVDRKILTEFPEIAVSLDGFTSQ